MISAPCHRGKPGWLLGLLVVAVMLLSPGKVVAQDISALKAAYIFYFSKFVTWNKEQENITVCVSTEDDSLLKQIQSLEGKTAGNKPIRIHFAKTELESVQECDVIYSHTPIKATAENYPGLLTVNDKMHPNTVIAFQVKDGKLSFNINAIRAKENDLKISSRLLHLAGEVVQ